MKSRSLLAGAVTLAVITSARFETFGQTNGVILISTRKAQDLSYATTDATDQKGPGQASQGDVAMAELLGDHGYSSRIIADAQLNTNLGGDPIPFLTPANPDFNANLVILSGSSGSADVPGMAGNGIPIIIGEHSCIGDRPLVCSCLMYTNGTQSGNITDTTGAPFGPGGQYMKVLQPNHPILQGIPLDTFGRIKIFRDRYPEENSHVPPGGKPNYEYSWTAIHVTNAAAGTTILGILDPTTTSYTNENQRAVFAVNDIGGILGDGSVNPVRLVHWIVCEDGSGGSRRMFNALTDIGRVLFVRTVKWALGQPLPPYQPLNIKVSAVSNTSIRLSWTASADKNYKILGSGNLATPRFNWETLSQDIPGINGTIQKSLDLSAAPQVAFLQVASVP